MKELLDVRDRIRESIPRASLFLDIPLFPQELTFWMFGMIIISWLLSGVWESSLGFPTVAIR